MKQHLKKPRLTKAAVLEEVKTLRDKIRTYCLDMDVDELQKQYNISFPGERGQKKTRESLLHGLLMSATYYMTNVLNVE